MVGGPVKVLPVVLIGNGILGPIAADVDVREGMSHGEIPRSHLGQSRFSALHGRGLVFMPDGNYHAPHVRMARLSFSGKPICACEFAFCLSVRYALYRGRDIWCISYRQALPDSVCRSEEHT